MKTLRSFVLGLVLVVAGFMTSCATTSNSLATANNLGKVYVTNTNKVKLLMPQYMEGVVDALYVFSANLGGQSFSALSYFYADDQEMSMLLLNDFGIEMGSLDYDGFKLDFSMAVAGGVKGEYIASDLENIFYPIDCLSENYSASGLTFTSSEDEGKIVRTISKKDKVIETITMTLNEDGIPQEVLLDNKLRSYSYKLSLTEEE